MQFGNVDWPKNLAYLDLKNIDLDYKALMRINVEHLTKLEYLDVLQNNAICENGDDALHLPESLKGLFIAWKTLKSIMDHQEKGKMSLPNLKGVYLYGDKEAGFEEMITEYFPSLSFGGVVTVS